MGRRTTPKRRRNRMAWFRKERKSRTPDRQKLEIQPDLWEKCSECGHVDVRDNFARNHEVCPACGYHRRIPPRPGSTTDAAPEGQIAAGAKAALVAAGAGEGGAGQAGGKEGARNQAPDNGRPRG